MTKVLNVKLLKFKFGEVFLALSDFSIIICEGEAFWIYYIQNASPNSFETSVCVWTKREKDV